MSKVLTAFEGILKEDHKNIVINDSIEYHKELTWRTQDL